LFGYDLGFMGGVTTSATFQNTFDHPNPSLLGFLVASYEIGALFGALIIFILGDRFGRRTINMSGVSVIAIGGAVQASSFGVPQFLVGRIVSGIGLGMTTSVIPIWLAECTIPKSRGRMIAIQLSHLILGLILSNWTDYGVSTYASSIQWRLPCALQICICILCLCILPWLPESPRWLAKVNRMAEARHNLAALRGKDTASMEVDKEMHEIHFALTNEAEAASSWTALFKNAGIGAWSRVVVAMAANAGQQLTGSNIISSFGPYIFQTSIGMSRHEALLVSGGLQVWFFASSLIPWFIIDRVGRRKSAVFVGVGGQRLGYAATVFMYLFYTFFTTGWQANMWICELFPSREIDLLFECQKLISVQTHPNSSPSTSANAAQPSPSSSNG
jgi:MFS family permease